MNNNYCSKSTTQRTREYMRQYRFQRQQSETLRMLESDEDEDAAMNISNSIDSSADDDVSDNHIPVGIDQPVSPSSSSDHESNSDSDNNEETDGDCVNDFVLLHDVNNQTKLFPGCPLSIREACLAIVKLARHLNLDKSGMKELLNGIRCLFPADVKLPRTVKKLLMVIGFDYSKRVLYYCRECLCRLQTPEQTTCIDGCSLNKQRRPFMNVIELVFNDVKDEIYSTAKRYINLINEYSTCSSAIFPSDVPNGSIYKRLTNKNKKQLTIMLHTDGAPVTKIGGKSLWPIQATILEIPPPVRDRANAVMVFGAWLGSTHPNRQLLWNNIVEQIRSLYETGITVRLNNNKKVKYNIRVQLITFDLPALAHNCNIIQFNGYDACPFCKIHGIAIGTQVFYPYSPTPSLLKSDRDYLQLALVNLPKSRTNGIKGPTPLTKILLFPVQICIDYMHLVCSGHFKTLITYWSNLLLPNVFEQASTLLSSVTLPHSFGYQFMQLTQFTNWKTKMFRDFLLYCSPIFVILFLPDKLALHFLHYFAYIRVLHFYQSPNELDGIDESFSFYFEHLSEHYGPKSELCTVHLHSHLLAQVKRHGSLSMTSCFPRESYIGNAVKWCQGKKYMLEQFITWYKVDRSLYSDSKLDINKLFSNGQLDDKYLDKLLVTSMNDKFTKCCEKQNIPLDKQNPVKQFARYFRGIKVFHSLSYQRGGYAISYWVSFNSNECLKNHGICFGEVIYYFKHDDKDYAFIKHYRCINKTLADGLTSVHVSQNLMNQLNKHYHFFHDEKYSYNIVLVTSIMNKTIRMPWIDPKVSVFTEIDMTTTTPRPQRTTAGHTSKYADYSVVSFPQLKKHSIIKTSLINIDPLSPAGTQVGNIKAYGDRKKLMIIKTGTRQEMEEISSRFSKEAGSEEIAIPERECEYEQDVGCMSMSGNIDDNGNDDDDEYTPSAHLIKKPTLTTTPNQRKQTIRATTNFSPLSPLNFDQGDDEDFSRILPSVSRSSIAKSDKRKNTEIDTSSFSNSSDDEHEVSGNRWSNNKENLTKSNVDLSNLKNKKSKKKRQRTEQVVVQQSNSECQALATDIELIKKRLTRLEKLYGIVKRNSSFDQSRKSATQNSQSSMTEDVLIKVQEIFGVDPSTLTSPINRPTKIMRELYKKSEHDLSKWKEYIEPNEVVLKEFIQQKCLILPEDIPFTWTTIINSMTQMPYDAIKYKAKPTVDTIIATEEPRDPSPATIND
ncbi:unnamed protein product [Adineta ricciae]|uniref:Transposase domain-containing protein n=1 Tax=Adineta ricciae TaxID=249248 RepID=A0A814Z7V5_ADIRI|nr:unnamed protein product [Adineta ricciae]CAF1491035.1 unnamed protein product [Adineta ricciae]